MILKILLLMLAGGLLTSYAEYKFKYNLYDLLKDKFSSLFKGDPSDLNTAG